MKTFASNLVKISVLVTFIIFFASCINRNKPENYFTIDNATYEIKSGSIINNGELDNSFSLELRLYDESKENFLSFAIVAPQAENIPSSTYTNLTGFWILGYKDGNYSSIGNISTGKVVIDRSSDGYSIEIECVDEYSNEIEGTYKGKLSTTDENNLVKKLPEYVLPNEIYEEVIQLIPVYSGTTPPDMTGEYVSSPHALIYESYGEKPDSLQFYSDRYIGFIYTNKQMNFYGKQYDSIERKYIEEIQYNVKITGSNDQFTCYYVVDGYVQGYYAQQAFIFSGKKTDAGLEDFHTAVILLETSGNPNMYEKHSYRVLKDYDGLAEKNNWLSGRSAAATSTRGNNAFDIWMK